MVKSTLSVAIGSNNVETMTVDLKKLHVSLAGLVRGQAELVAKSDNKISLRERKAIV